MTRIVASALFLCNLGLHAQVVLPFVDCVDRVEVVSEFTTLPNDVPALSGSVTLPVFIQAGATLTLNPGGPNEETFRTGPISGPGPYVISLQSATQFAHLAGEQVRFQRQVATTAYFGYFNPNSQSVSVTPGSSSNFFSPGNPDRGQPGDFLPGVHHRAAALPVVVGRDTVWVLNQQFAVARHTEEFYCNAPRPPAVTAESITLAIGTTLPGARLGATELMGPGVTATAAAFEGSGSGVQACSTIGIGNVSVQNGVIYGDVTSPSNTGANRCSFILRVTGPAGVQNTATGIVQTTSTCTASVLPSSLTPAVAGVAYSVTFNAGSGSAFAIEGALPAGLTLSGATLSGTPQQTGSFPFVLRITGSDGCIARTAYTLTVTGAVCATTITPQVQITLGGFRQNLVNRHWLQTVTLRNGGAAPISGPVAFVLDNLSSNAALSNASGLTACALPLGRPYLLVDVGTDGTLSPGESASATLDFTNSNAAQAITYTPNVLAGGTLR